MRENPLGVMLSAQRSISHFQSLRRRDPSPVGSGWHYETVSRGRGWLTHHFQWQLY